MKNRTRVPEAILTVQLKEDEPSGGVSSKLEPTGIKPWILIAIRPLSNEFAEKERTYALRCLDSH